MPIPNGYALWSAISDVANPSIVTNSLGDETFNKALDCLDRRTPQGHRRDLLVCNTKLVKSLIIRHILENQQNSSQHSYKIVKDERINNYDRFMPIIAVRHSRPVISENPKYRTTAHSGRFSK